MTNTLISDMQDFAFSENKLHLNDRIIHLIVNESNRYATNNMIENAEQANNFFVEMWRPVDCIEIKTFIICLFIFIGILRKSSVLVDRGRIMTHDRFRW